MADKLCNCQQSTAKKVNTAMGSGIDGLGLGQSLAKRQLACLKWAHRIKTLSRTWFIL